MKQFIVADLLSEGRENATPRRSLKNTLQINERLLYKLIEKERRKGAPILSQKDNGGGYFLPASDDETDEYLNTAMNNIISNLRSYYGIKYAGEPLKEEVIEMLRTL